MLSCSLSHGMSCLPQEKWAGILSPSHGIQLCAGHVTGILYILFAVMTDQLDV